jgi:hypothetical protein
MSKQTFEIGDLLVRVSTGTTALVTGSRPSRRSPYGDPDIPRMLFRLLEAGEQVWKHDLQIAAEYQHAAATSAF